MLSVKGEFENGVATPVTEVPGREGQAVIITFLEEEAAHQNGLAQANNDDGGAALLKLIRDCQTASGLGDLAHEHDHYLYGTPKRLDR